jgi:Serine endopeptidase inhibitors
MRDKTESPTPETSEQSVPFFARFLEGQDTSMASFKTLKFPSDLDEIDWYLSSNKGPQQ